MKRIVIAIFLITGPIMGCLMSQQYRVIRDLDSRAGSERFDPARFRAIDAYALDAPDAAASTIETLAAYLARPEWDELARTRAIWRWITARIDYDVAKRNYTARETLRDRRGTCQGYAELFVLLARRAGITALEITGYLRGSGFRPGDRSRNDHAWNAVRIGTEWHLMDLTYGAGVVSGGTFTRRYMEHYFLAPPGEFMYTHLPEVRRWRLLPGRLSKHGFDLLPLYRPGFFRYGLRPAGSDPSCVISCSGGLTLRFIVPPGIAITADVRDREGRSLLKPAVIRRGEIIEVSAVFTGTGDYYLSGWAGPESMPVKDRALAFSYLVKNR